MILISGLLAWSWDFKEVKKNMTYRNCRTVIENQKRRGTLDVEAMTAKLDVFLLADRITESEYNELIKLMEE